MRGQHVDLQAGQNLLYKFMWNGEVIRQSTRQTNQNVARQMEAAHRSALAKGEVGIRRREPIPTLAEFIKSRVRPRLEASTSAKTWIDYYRPNLDRISSYAALGSQRLDKITSEKAADFAAWRKSKGLQVSSVNSSLQVLRRVLRLALEWGVLEQVPRIKMLPGERHREHVVTPDEEARYLAAATEPLASIAVILLDTGLRPDECYRLEWQSISWANGKYGTLLVTHGKTAAARRVLPMTPRVRQVLETHWKASGCPVEGWVWSAPTASAHFEKSTLKKRHSRALKLSRVRPFVLYTSAHLSHAPRRIGLRRMDAGSDRRAQFNSYVCALRSSERERRFSCSRKAEWAQFWAQRSICAS